MATAILQSTYLDFSNSNVSQAKLGATAETFTLTCSTGDVNVYGVKNLTSSATLTGLSITDGVATMSAGAVSGLTSIGCDSVTATGTVTADTFTDGTATLTGGDLSATNATLSATMTALSITDGVATLSAGAVSGVTSIGCDSVTATATITADTFTDGVATMSAGAVSGVTSIGCDSVTATGTVTAGTFTDGTATLTGGNLTATSATMDTLNINAAGYIVATDATISCMDLNAVSTINANGEDASGMSTQIQLNANGADMYINFTNNGSSHAKIGVTDETITLTCSTGDVDLDGVKNLTSSATVTALSVTDGVATLTAGAVSGVTSIGCDSVTATGTVTAGTFTDGTATLTGGNLTATTLTATSATMDTLTITQDGNIVATDATISCMDLNAASNVNVNATLTVNTFTDGTAYITAGAISDVTSIGCDSVTATATITADTFTDGTATLTGGSLSGLASPVNANDAANKAYVDSVAQGISWKEKVAVATTASGNLSTDFASGSTVDGVVLVAGWRILIKDQSSGAENGIYLVQASGAPLRAHDLAVGHGAASVALFIQQGTTHHDCSFVCTNDTGADVVGTNALTFTIFARIGDITAGLGLTRDGNDIYVNVDDSTIEISSDSLRIKDSGVTNSKLANPSLTVTAGDGLQNGGVVALGDSVSIAVDSTVVRTSGTQTIGGQKTLTDATLISNATVSSSSTTGALVVTGGAGIGDDLFVGGDSTVTGAAYATSFNATSDARLKENIELIGDEAIDKLLSIKSVQYNFINQDRLHYGVLAQDLQEHGLGSLVHEQGSHLSVDYNNLVGILVGSVQALTKRVKELESTIVDLQ